MELGAAFRDASASYKFFWFLAILDLLPHLDAPVAVRTVVKKMVAGAWVPVTHYRLSLGRIDRLQDCVLQLQEESGLDGRASARAVDNALDRWVEFSRWAHELARFVPGRFLGVWFPQVASAKPYDRKGATDVTDAAGEAWLTPNEAPYRLRQANADGEVQLEMSASWRDWLSEHESIVRSFANYELCRFLQSRNPNVPGIMNKLYAPRRRQLTKARQFWSRIIAEEAAASRTLLDLYTGQRVEAAFDLDHFLPWSFVTHDQIWNLVPVASATNRRKRDHIPDIERFLPELAKLHVLGVARSVMGREIAQDYAEFFGVDAASLSTLSPKTILARLEEVIRPLAQIAINQGFPSSWRPG